MKFYIRRLAITDMSVAYVEMSQDATWVKNIYRRKMIGMLVAGSTEEREWMEKAVRERNDVPSDESVEIEWLPSKKGALYSHLSIPTSVNEDPTTLQVFNIPDIDSEWQRYISKENRAALKKIRATSLLHEIDNRPKNFLTRFLYNIFSESVRDKVFSRDILAASYIAIRFQDKPHIKDLNDRHYGYIAALIELNDILSTMREDGNLRGSFLPAAAVLPLADIDPDGVPRYILLSYVLVPYSARDQYIDDGICVDEGCI